jgi:hypothetical protein
MLVMSMMLLFTMVAWERISVSRLSPVVVGVGVRMLVVVIVLVEG